MNCILSRRLLAAQPRRQSAEHRAHIADCAPCARLAHALSGFEDRLEGAALVESPDELSDRVIAEMRAKRLGGARSRWRSLLTLWSL